MFQSCILASSACLPRRTSHSFFLEFFSGTFFVLPEQIVRVTLTQSSTIYSTYLSDQLREDMRRDELVNEGRLTRVEADQQADDWAEVSQSFHIRASSEVLTQ